VEHIPETAMLAFMTDSFRCLRDSGMLRISTGPCPDLDRDALNRGDESWWYWFKDRDFVASIDSSLPPMSIYDYWLFSVATARSLCSATPCDKKYNKDEIASLVRSNQETPTELLGLLTDSLPFDINFPGNHISWWNFDKLRAFLWKAGFSNVRRSSYGQSTSELMRDLRYFDQTYPQISVYVEAIK
jgi:hypothetical protein